MRQFLGFDSVPPDYAVVGSLAYEPVTARLEDLQARALGHRPDFQAALRSVTASESPSRWSRSYGKSYLDQATQSLEITKFSYEHGAASLLDFLDAERSYRTTQLSYRQALATYLTSIEQLRQAVGNCSEGSSARQGGTIVSQNARPGVAAKIRAEPPKDRSLSHHTAPAHRVF